MLGLIFGSFITALSYRLPRGQSIAKGRSACPSCGTTLTPKDLVPVFSWVMHGGKCGHCGARVSWRYPAIEILMALLFSIAALVVTDFAQLVLVLAATPVMMTLAIIDIEHRRLPNSLLLILALLFVALRAVGDRDFVTAVLAAALVFGAAIAFDTAGRRLIRQGLSMGDAKLMAAAALALPPIWLLAALGTAGLIGAGGAILLGVRSHRRDSHFPFGPALLLAFWGAIITL
ncbi:MAG: prepilin peptidase [Proteobacteria bacterium]|nr:prepilin peptidase [Pseudomonadota bacterium]